jgi:hypothetical protein
MQKSFSTEMFAGAIISVVQYLVPLRYMTVPDGAPIVIPLGWGEITRTSCHYPISDILLAYHFLRLVHRMTQGPNLGTLCILIICN